MRFSNKGFDAKFGPVKVGRSACPVGRGRCKSPTVSSDTRRQMKQIRTGSRILKEVEKEKFEHIQSATTIL